MVLCKQGCLCCNSKEVSLKHIKKTPFYCPEEDCMKFDMRAIQGKVILFPLPPETKYNDSLIEIPIQYQEFYKSWKGIILSVGPGYYEQSGEFIPTELEVGNLVLFNKDIPWYSSRKGVDGKEHPIVICSERDVWILIGD